MSFDGSIVAFDSLAYNLDGSVVDGNRKEDVYYRRWLAENPSTHLVSRNIDQNRSGDSGSFDAELSDNGSVIVFGSMSTDLTSLLDINGPEIDLFVFDVSITKLVAPKAAGHKFTPWQGLLNGQFLDVSFDLSHDGRYVFFTSSNNGLVDGVYGGGHAHAFVFDRGKRQ